MTNNPLRTFLVSIKHVFLIITPFLWGLSAQAEVRNNVDKDTVQSIRQVNESWQKSLIQGDITKVIEMYADNAIFMPEYQPTLNGSKKIRTYLEALSARRKIKSLRYKADEMHNLGQYVLEIGTFATTIDWIIEQQGKTISYEGKYWRIWNVKAKNTPQVVGEAFGFFEHIPNPELWVTDMGTKQDPAPSGFNPAEASIELKAYHAIGREGVKHKDGELRSQLYAPDAIFYPFADSPKKGIEVLKPYLIQYSSHGARIESVQTHTHEVINVDGYILEFAKFAVAWTYDNVPGRADGKGISLRKRMANGELLIYRHIGTHNFDR